jgi:hypothetical protein
VSKIDNGASVGPLPRSQKYGKRLAQLAWASALIMGVFDHQIDRPQHN